METHIVVRIYGDSYIGCNVWRIILREQCMETNMKITIYGDS